MRRAVNLRALTLAFAATAGCFSACFAIVAKGGSDQDHWSPQEIAAIASLRLNQAGGALPDPSNAYEGSRDAIALGRALFNDPRFSANGQVSCATCHIEESQFADALPRGQGIGAGKRRTMPIMGAVQAPFLFWDGRKDSLWSQALGPLEDALEHGGNRVGITRIVATHYRADYERVFGPLPELRSLPEAASPNGSPAERAAWARLAESSRTQVNWIYANMGKAIAAFERTFSYGESRFDRYAEAIASGDEAGQRILSPQEARGLRAFLTRGQCITCHNGPLFTDHAFHNTGVPQTAQDTGRHEGIRKLLNDEFNCLGKYSDARPEQCTELLYMSEADASQIGSFRTPGLRNVALRAPYMHAGQFADLEQAIDHYRRAPAAALGRSEIAAGAKQVPGRIGIQLTRADIQDIVAFLGTLSGPVLQSGK